MYGLEEFNFLAAGLAILGAFGTFWYMGRFYEAGLALKLFSSVIMLPIGYFVAAFILEK